MNKEQHKSNFIEMLLHVDRDQLTQFIKEKGREPKLTKPFICLDSNKLDK
jgi:hypothetical protein